MEFIAKERERQRQEQEDSDDNEADTEDSSQNVDVYNKKKRKAKKNAHSVSKHFDEPPALTYRAVKAELGERPLPVGMGKDYCNKRDFFELIFEYYGELPQAQGWRDKPYVHGLQLLKTRLEQEDFRYIKWRLWKLFKTSVHCVHVISKFKFIEVPGRVKTKPGWVAFDEDGIRMDCSSVKAFLAFEKGSSWRETRSICEDKYWKMSIDEVIEMIAE